VNAWPELKYDDWADTAQTLHMWTQIAGKIRMAKTPPLNHSWHVTLYVTSRGLTTSMIPNGDGMFEIAFDFIDHKLIITTSNGESRSFALQPMTVASFYEQMMASLAEAGVRVTINTMPSEVADGISFPNDTRHHSYDPDAASRFWRVLLNACRVFTTFRARFTGKVSPIHLFWGALDLAVTRFSGREAPMHDPVPSIPLAIVRDAYSHEVSSAGFWPGGGGFDAAFYSYAYPEPNGYGAAKVQPAEAFYSSDLREFFLPYEAMRNTESPDDALMQFLESTYEAAANLGGWDRQALER
jgi:hypothetical protein